MCIVTEEIPGEVVEMAGDVLMVRYDEGIRVQSGSLMRTVFFGSVHCPHQGEIGVGDRVICQVQRVGSHAYEPLLAVRKIPEI